MNNFTSITDVDVPVRQLVNDAVDLKRSPFSSSAGANKTLGLIFFNPSLRTRMSTQKAAFNLGMNVISMNISEESWQMEFEDGSVMDGKGQEHIKDAVKVMSQYVDVLAVRTFARLDNQSADYAEPVLSQFLRYSEVPVISLESATLHPLQSLADVMTLSELGISKPRIAFTWAPHPKALPQAVTNSFLQWASNADLDVILACPPGYEPSERFLNGIPIVHDQNEALAGADVVYAKNWSSFQEYGKILTISTSWMIDRSKMALTNNGKFMHCLPVRRNVVVSDEVLDSHSVVYQQAANRVYSAQAVLKNILESRATNKD